MIPENGFGVHRIPASGFKSAWRLPTCKKWINALCCVFMSPYGSDYRSILKEEFARRAEQNQLYSLRAFARDLGMGSARLSEILSGKSGLSRPTAEKIARRLKMNIRDTEYFCTLVESEHARSRTQRELARQRLRDLSHAYEPLKQDVFRLVSDWYHLPLIEMTKLPGFRGDAGWIASALGISVADARGALERLQRLGLLEESEDGTLSASGDFSTVVQDNDVPSVYVREFHRQISEQSQAALSSQDVSERDHSAVMFRFAAERMDEAKETVRRFRREFDRRFGGDESADEVYCLAIQFFRLTEGSQ